MKNITGFFLITLAIVVINQSLFAQNDGGRYVEDDVYTKIIPPSPTAYELGKYGQVPVGYFTGTPSISVPLYTYQAGKISIPISLSYNSNGIKVDQLSSNVGLGWSLNAGGVITRIVNDLPDEESNPYYPQAQMDDLGNPMTQQYFIDGTNPINDSEADVFMYNFMGYSGKFVFDNDKKIVLIPVKDIYIEPLEDGYRITTADGVKYEFKKIETNKSRRYLQGKSGGQFTIVNSSWFLTKIIHPAGDVVDFIYQTESYKYNSSYTQYHTRSFYLPPCPQSDYFVSYVNESHIVGYRISQIASNKEIHGKLYFTYGIEHPGLDNGNYELISRFTVKDKDELIIEDISFDYLLTSKKRVFLKSVTYNDPTKQYSFDYIDQNALCERLSFAQDHWGYFNNKTANRYLLPKITEDGLYINSQYAGDRNPNNTYAQKGLLRKITYPTKGFNEFEYEMNSYWGTETIYPPQLELHLEAYTTDYGGFTATENTVPINFNHVAYINSSVLFEGSCEQTQTAKATISITDLNTGSPILIYDLDGIAISRYVEITENATGNFRVNLEEGTVYKVELKVLRPCESASLDLLYYGGNTTEVNKNLETGGSRIKYITTNDPVTGITETKRYYYNTYEKLDESSGDPGSNHLYISRRKSRTIEPLPCDYIECDYKVLQSNSLTNLFNTGNNNIYYPFVTVSYGDDNFKNGGETHEFVLHRDVQGKPLVGDTWAQSPSTWTNFGWNNGLELSVLTFKVQNNVKKPVTLLTNNYVEDFRRRDTVFSYAIMKNFDITCPPNIWRTCTEEEASYQPMENYCANDTHKHIWWLGFSGTRCIAIGAINTERPVNNPCFGKPGETLHYPDALDNLNVTEYMHLSSWNYLNSSTLEEYSSNNNDKITKTTEYFYDNPQHLQLSRVENVDSKGNTVRSISYYPEDYTNSIFDGLLANNIKNVPIDQRTIYNGKLQNGRLTHYNDIGQPVDMYAAENELGTDLAFYENNPYSYANGVKKRILKYDQNSNTLLSYKTEDNIETVILWGYNYTYPIAKIENAEYDKVIQALDVDDYADLQTKSSIELKNLFMQLIEASKLPTHALYNSMIHAYTYDPLIGMTSETDPNGVITTYHYDQFNRLEMIKDGDGNILKKIEYNYSDPE